MMIAIDTETRGLDATKFLTGCIIKDTPPYKPEIYRNKQEMWNRILELGRMEQKRGHILNVYAHNHSYDFYAYADLTDPNIKWFCQKPFIVAYMMEKEEEILKEECENCTHSYNNEEATKEEECTCKYETIKKKTEAIKFLDTMSIYKFSLEKLGKILNNPKTETPKELYNEKEKITNKKLKEIETYMIQDTKIVLQSIQEIRKEMNKEDIKVKRLCTINQIAINALINYWRKRPEHQHVFWKISEGEIKRTLRSQEIHQAYRGGRVEPFQIGKFQKATLIDINSLYPIAATKIQFPKLETERMTVLRTEDKKEIKEWLTKNPIGITRCLIKNNNNTLGMIPIRTPDRSYYPKSGKMMIGTWTNLELNKAIKEGYTILSIEWGIKYEEADNNPIGEYMKEMYQKRKEAKNELEKYFYKSLMNSCLGKLAQVKESQEITIDSVEKAEEYLQKNYQIIKGIGLNYLYKKEPETNKRQYKKYYCPIIPTLVNAQARIIIYEQLKKIEEQDLLYTDTDSIMCKNWNKYQKEFEIGKEMGQFKIEQLEQPALIYGRKTYMIGEEIKAAGAYRKNLNKQEFEAGTAKETKMITIKKTNDIEKAGKFQTTIRDLKEQSRLHLEIEEKYSEQTLLIDDGIENIDYFLKTINLEK